MLVCAFSFLPTIAKYIKKFNIRLTSNNDFSPFAFAAAADAVCPQTPSEYLPCEGFEHFTFRHPSMSAGAAFFIAKKFREILPESQAFMTALRGRVL
jgi:hypothetical protein